MLAMRRGAHSHVDMAAGWSLLWGASSSVSSSMVVTAALQHGLARGRLAAGPAHGSMALEPLGQLETCAAWRNGGACSMLPRDRHTMPAASLPAGSTRSQRSQASDANSRRRRPCRRRTSALSCRPADRPSPLRLYFAFSHCRPERAQAGEGRLHHPQAREDPLAPPRPHRSRGQGQGPAHRLRCACLLAPGS